MNKGTAAAVMATLGALVLAALAWTSDGAVRRHLATGEWGGPGAVGRYEEIRERLGEDHPNFGRLFGVKPASLSAAEREKIGEEEVRRRVMDPERPYIRQVRHKLFVESMEALLDRIAAPEFNVLESTTGLVADLEKVPVSLGGMVEQVTELRHRDMGLEVKLGPASPGAVRFEMRAKMGGLLQIGEPAAPGWRVEIDGKLAADAVRPPGDGLFLTLRVPAGRHEIAIEYDPISRRLAIYLMLLSVAMIGFCIGNPYGSSRRKSTPGPTGPETDTPQGPRKRVLEIDE